MFVLQNAPSTELKFEGLSKVRALAERRRSLPDFISTKRHGNKSIIAVQR
jgi:hypothetical protein